MAIAFVQSRSVDGGSVTSAALAFTSNVTAGSLLIIAVRIGANGRTITVSDDKANTYQTSFAVLDDLSGDDMACYYAMNAAAGATTVTVAISGAAATIRFGIHEYSGLATSGALDQATRQTFAVSATPDSGNVTTLVADELLFGYEENTAGGAANPVAPGTGYTLREQVNVAGSIKLVTEDKIVSVTGTYSAGFTLAGTESGGVSIATFKIAGGATAVFTPYAMHRMQELMTE